MENMRLNRDMRFLERASRAKSFTAALDVFKIRLPNSHFPLYSTIVSLYSSSL